MKNTAVVIVKKKRGHGHGHHGGAWKVAYADFVTAMMAFFLVLWIVGQSKPVKAGVAGYFRDPGVLEQARSTGILPGGNEGVSPNATPKVESPQGIKVQTADERAALEKKAATLRQMLARTPEFKSLLEQIEIQVTSEGLRIELIETSDSLFFDTGSAVLKPETVRLLTAIAGELSSLPNPIVLEGHSDSRRYSTSGVYSNWELSSDRANAARRVMEQGGLHPGQIGEVRGYADTRLRVKANPLDPRNRRVSIVVANRMLPSQAEAAVADANSGRPTLAPALAPHAAAGEVTPTHEEGGR
jgi:chemotaxis protein MotB